MHLLNKKEPVILFLGDAILLYSALWLTLLVRYGTIPGNEVFFDHITPFSILFVVWVFIFFVAGLYEKHTLILKSHLPGVLLNTQLINIVVAVLFFYFIPYFGIAPKTNLFIYIIISSILILGWRMFGVHALGMRKRQKAILIGSGEEMKELKEEVNNNARYNLKFVSSVNLDNIADIDFNEEILNKIYSENITTVVIDMQNKKTIPIMPELYHLIFAGVHFISKYKVYEDIFDRIPISLIGYNWFLENISHTSHLGYDILKRGMDISVSLVLGVISFVIYPFVYVAIKFDDGGPMFFRQERVGKGNKSIYIFKFRSMSTEENKKVTRLGSILRKTRLDELPQLWNVLIGDISLVGPRPEIPTLVKKYEQDIPYYDTRHIIKPGLSGWAQMYHENHPHHNADVEETKRKLSYDLYYIKNRSFLLDLKIALKTMKVLISQKGI